MDDRISVSVSDGVADVRLVRADKMNALDAAMFEALVNTSARLATEKGVRAVVPSTYAVDAFAAALKSSPRWSTVGVDLGVCVGVCVLALAASAWAFRRAVASR